MILSSPNKLDTPLNYKKVVSKKYGKISTVKKLQLKKAIFLYWKKLKDLGIRVPERLDILESDFPEKEVSLIEPFYHLIAENILKKGTRKEYANLTKKILNNIRIILSQGREIKVSLDPKSVNFALANHDLVYIDFVPPLLKTQKFYWTFKRIDEKEQKLEWKLKRYFTPIGLLQVFYTRTLLCRLEFGEILTEEILKTIQDLPNHLSSEIKESFFYFLLKVLIEDKFSRKETKHKLKKEVENATMKERDLLRMIFILGLSKGRKKSFDQIDRFFKLSKKPKNLNLAKTKILKGLVDIS